MENCFVWRWKSCESLRGVKLFEKSFKSLFRQVDEALLIDHRPSRLSKVVNIALNCPDTFFTFQSHWSRLSPALCVKGKALIGFSLTKQTWTLSAYDSEVKIFRVENLTMINCALASCSVESIDEIFRCEINSFFGVCEIHSLFFLGVKWKWVRAQLIRLWIYSHRSTRKKSRFFVSSAAAWEFLLETREMNGKNFVVVFFGVLCIEAAALHWTSEH